MKAKFFALMAVLAIFYGIAMQPASATASSKNQTLHVSSRTAQQARAISLTKPEARTAGMNRLVENFEKIDANNDGVVTRNELRAYALATRRHVPMT